MRPDARGRQQGFGLVAALFVIIVITLVIAAMARLSTTQHGSNSAVNMAGGGLSEFTVSLTCSSTSHTDDDGSGLTIYRLTAQAQNGAPGSRPDYAFRRLTAVVER